MIYVSVDTETTGLDEKQHQLIEFGAIIEDSNNPKPLEELQSFRRIVLNREDKYIFSSYACSLNKKLMDTIAIITKHLSDPRGYKEINKLFHATKTFNDSWCFEDELGYDFKQFLARNGMHDQIVIAGKNPGFDKRFLGVLPKFLQGKGGTVKLHHRHLDPALSFIDWEKDVSPPSTELCKTRAALPNVVAHEAIQDAWDIILLIRSHIRKEQRYETMNNGSHLLSC